MERRFDMSADDARELEVLHVEGLGVGCAERKGADDAPRHAEGDREDRDEPLHWTQ